MKGSVVAVLIVPLAFYFVEGDDLLEGSVSKNLILAKHDFLQFNAIPFMMRVKDYTYKTNNNKTLIQAIVALDTLKSSATIDITAGGIGSNHVTLHIKSARGTGLAYDISIYVNNHRK